MFGSPDYMKLKSSITLFEQACPNFDVFGKVIEKFFNGKRDEKTIQLITATHK